ncbi:MAG: hypothetical protein LUQ59_09115 [Methanothrix sp.]|nr:hypothetical protein [Methanothrix sp.]
MFSCIGLAYIGCSEEGAAGTSGECSCYKIMYMDSDDKNLTVEISAPSCDCSENSTKLLYMDSSGHCLLNGEQSPFCKCNEKMNMENCTCLANLTFNEMMGTLKEKIVH